MRWDVRIRLSLMMFLQYAVWGAYSPILSVYLEKTLKYDGTQMAQVGGTTALAAIFAPILFGVLADRFIATERLLAVMHLLGAGLLYAASGQQEYGRFYPIMLLYAFLYMPTLALTNSLAFSHIADPARQFPGVRIFGTLGWIAVGLFAGFYLKDTTPQPLVFGAALSVALAVVCLALPHTPPPREEGDVFPAARALGLLRKPQFATFMLVSFAVSIVLAYYYQQGGNFLKDLGVKDVQAKMTIGQMSEAVLLVALPWFLLRAGLKVTIALGMLAWAARYGIFAAANTDSVNVVIVSLVLHGICYDFFFVASQLYVDKAAPPAIRASAQALLAMVTLGLGMYVGHLLCGEAMDVAKVTRPDPTSPDRTILVTDWKYVWLPPALGVLAALALFWGTFKNPSEDDTAVPIEPASHKPKPADDLVNADTPLTA